MLKHVNVICSSGRFYVSSMFPIITVKCKIRYWNSFDNICLQLVFKERNWPKYRFIKEFIK